MTSISLCVSPLLGHSDVANLARVENVVHGALTTYDLPDLRRTLPADKFLTVEPLGASENPLTDSP